MSKPIIQELQEAQASIDRARALLLGDEPVKSNYDSHVDWSKILERFNEPISGMVDKAAEEVKESFKNMGEAPTWPGYKEAQEKAFDAYKVFARGNCHPVTDVKIPKTETRPLTEDEIDGIARWAAKRELERGKPPADDPRPLSETIVVADKYITPMRDDPGAGVFFKRRWWWPF